MRKKVGSVKGTHMGGLARQAVAPRYKHGRGTSDAPPRARRSSLKAVSYVLRHVRLLAIFQRFN